MRLQLLRSQKVSTGEIVWDILSDMPVNKTDTYRMKLFLGDVVDVKITDIVDCRLERTKPDFGGYKRYWQRVSLTILDTKYIVSYRQVC